MVYHENINQKKAGMSILVPNEVDFRSNTIARDREGHYIMVKGSIHQKDIAILNMCHLTAEPQNM